MRKEDPVGHHSGIPQGAVTQGFRSGGTHRLHEGYFVKRLSGIELAARKKLRLLDAAASRADLGAITNGMRGISADTALRLARYFGTSPR